MLLQCDSRNLAVNLTHDRRRIIVFVPCVYRAPILGQLKPIFKLRTLSGVRLLYKFSVLKIIFPPRSYWWPLTDRAVYQRNLRGFPLMFGRASFVPWMVSTIFGRPLKNRVECRLLQRSLPLQYAAYCFFIDDLNCVFSINNAYKLIADGETFKTVFLTSNALNSYFCRIKFDLRLRRIRVRGRKF